ncbi:MAG: DivIVA domain-containing protein [Acidimicrobiales bacterium]
MDSSPPTDQASGSQAAAKPSIDSLRTVEFRTTLRGYHMDDVDEYLERVAVEAEALQEQVRLASDRIKQSNERATSLEQQLEQARRTQQAQAAQQAQKTQQGADASERTEVTDDSLQRTLQLAQKFVDQTRQDAEREASDLISTSEARARSIVADAEEHVRVMTEDAERSLREEVKRLDSHRAELVADVETIARHLEAERARIRKALTDMLSWVDEHVQAPKSAGSRTPGPADRTSDKVRDRVQAPAESGERASNSEAPDVPAQVRRPAEPAKADHRGDEADADKRGIDSNADGAESGDNSDREALHSTRADATMSGPPTEKIPASSPEATDLDEIEVPDDEMAVRPGGPRDQPSPRGSADRSSPAHQRQMFAPGREPRQAGSTVIR